MPSSVSRNPLGGSSTQWLDWNSWPQFPEETAGQFVKHGKAYFNYWLQYKGPRSAQLGSTQCRDNKADCLP